ncbi:MAG: methyltransferase family protein [Sphaerospermopsis kisseleviana]
MKTSMWLAEQLLLLCAIFVLGWRDWDKAETEWISVVGGGVMLAALVVAVSGFRALGRNLSPGPRPLREHSLVTHGIYRRVRHPLYTSLLLLSIGWAIFTHSWIACAATLVLLAFLHMKARVEEKHLESIYPQYRNYAARTGSFLPRPWN